ncbi:PhzF family phenazine biosynthesis protein [Natronospira proteinivora]|uniref:PhzF family phenazine biosynthesis protein n=1 Tax=Natronospira proteinivora TaxID=1807133 RepID=A0ABT1GAW7_9GAMM|nr:PhzF family phenazine biosynthesis protein [Natronospira proteinivora]MCP1728471.1 PhzF family phenazine biosynthesis protein [Natronospira proteinivora]
MTRLPIFQVDAFSDQVFAGNPAAVVPLPSWLPEVTLQAIAAENNLSETAFVMADGHRWQIRWFTPSREVDLCGHATLASAWVIQQEFGLQGQAIEFDSASGPLTVSNDEAGRLVLDFPSRPPVPADTALRAELTQALGEEPEVVMQATDVLAVYRQIESIQRMQPDMAAMAALDARGVIVTAPGRGCDFVSRFFAPKVGVPEDPVTGSAHCTLIPYWAKRLEVTRLHARQVSKRGGELFCRALGDRVQIAGHASLYMSGVIQLPDET